MFAKALTSWGEDLSRDRFQGEMSAHATRLRAPVEPRELTPGTSRPVRPSETGPHGGAVYTPRHRLSAIHIECPREDDGVEIHWCVRPIFRTPHGGGKMNRIDTNSGDVVNPPSCRYIVPTLRWSKAASVEDPCSAMRHNAPAWPELEIPSETNGLSPPYTRDDLRPLSSQCIHTTPPIALDKALPLPANIGHARANREGATRPTTTCYHKATSSPSIQKRRVRRAGLETSDEQVQ